MTAETVTAGSFAVPPDHPSLPGHFPGHPVAPGVLLLDEVLALIAPHLPSRIAGVGQVKFLRPVLPGEAVTVSVVASTGAFTAAVGGRTVLRGQVRSRPA